MAGPADVSMVVPSFYRADALRENLPCMLAIEGLVEVIVGIEHDAVDDTPAVIDEIGDERLRLVRNHGRPGLSALRNLGAAEAKGEWIVYGEDDCRFPPDYVNVLKREALSNDAQVVGAPWLHVDPGTDVLGLLERLRTTEPRTPAIDAHGVVPADNVETPFMPALVLVRRDVFDEISFDEGYQGNAYRQETAFFVEAMRGGYRCLLTPYTASYQVEQWNSGGSRSSRLTYEISALRNNWRFMRHHGDWLAERGYIPGKLRFQAAFSWERFSKTVGGFVSSRVGRRDQ